MLKCLIVFCLLFMVSCTGQKPEMILLGQDACHHCRMKITDPRFGGELVTKKGKVYKFDSLECLHEYKNLHSDEYKIYVVNSLAGGALIEAEKAEFEVRSDIRSPMGLGILAQPLNEKSGGEVTTGKTGSGAKLKWDDILTLIKKK